MKNPHDPTELIQYSGEHLMHEITMLWQTADAIPRYKPDTVEYVALLESFVTHLRNLIEFLFKPIKWDYVRARHFFDDQALWQWKDMPPIWKDLYQRACHEVNHLLTDRIDGEPASKDWEAGKIVTEIDPILREFASKAAPNRLHPKVREFFQQPSDRAVAWIGENVHHPNVAVSAPFYQPPSTVLPDVSASIATVTKK